MVQNTSWQPAAFLLENAGQKLKRTEELMGVCETGRKNPSDPSTFPSNSIHVRGEEELKEQEPKDLTGQQQGRTSGMI